MAECSEATRQVAQVVTRGLAAGRIVEIDGLGTFYPDARLGFRFEPLSPPPSLPGLRQGGRGSGRPPLLRPRSSWVLSVDGRPQAPARADWPRAIQQAIETSDFFLACFSSRSVRKRGGFQAEIRYALDCARQVPLDQIFLVPVRLDPCEVPRALQAEFQWIDLFPNWDRGIAVLTAMIRREIKKCKR